MDPCVRRDDPVGVVECRPAKTIQREVPRIAAQIRRRVERLAVDRAIEVLAPERWVPDLRRKRVIDELAVTGQYFGAGVEPGALGDIDSGARPLLIGHIGTVRSVIGTAALVILALGLRAGRWHVESNGEHGEPRTAV